MKYLKALISQDPSVSTMRLMSLACCLTAIVIAFVGLSKTVIDYSGLSMLCGTFLSIAFTGKVMQKRIEVEQPKDDK